MIDHERIYLEPSPGADEDYGRQWCQHNVWDEATEYVRADLLSDVSEERDRLREALSECQTQAVKDGNEISNLRAWQAGAISCREAEEGRITEYKAETDRLREENTRFEDKIEDIIAEFGADPLAALQIISEHISLRRHGRSHPNARGEE